MGSVEIWKRIGRWGARGFLALLIVFTTWYWLDILVFSAGEYERLIGSEAACGATISYCSWTAFVWSNIPDVIIAVVALVALFWRRLPQREPVLGGLALMTFAYFVGRTSTMGLGALCADLGLFP